MYGSRVAEMCSKMISIVGAVPCVEAWRVVRGRCFIPYLGGYGPCKWLCHAVEGTRGGAGGEAGEAVRLLAGACATVFGHVSVTVHRAWLN